MWGGRLIGAFFGFLFMGPWGGLLGFYLGYRFDQGFLNHHRILREMGERLHGHSTIQSAFFTATFSVMGHLARIDGCVTEAEISSALRVMEEMQLSAAERGAAIALFRKGKLPDFPLDTVLRDLFYSCRARHDLLHIFLEIQFKAAYADGEIGRAEKALLQHIGARLGFSQLELIRIDALFRRDYARFYGWTEGPSQSSGGGQSRTDSGRPQARPLDRAYQILGVSSDVTVQGLKRAYRKLMSQHHPDKLVAKGLPEAMLKMATEKTQEIRAAYEEIKLAKGWQ
jgi:DnaJ like chaperone protein